MDDGTGYTEYDRPRWMPDPFTYYSTAYGTTRVSQSVRSHSVNDVGSLFIKASRICAGALGGQLRLWCDYAFAKENIQRRRQAIGQQIVQNEIVYVFDYVLDSDSEGTMYAIFDVEAWKAYHEAHNFDMGTIYPPRREMFSQQDVVIAEFTGTMDAELDYDLHELTLGLEWARRLGNRFDLFVAVGPTINILDWTFSHETSWMAAGDDDFAEVRADKKSDTDIVIGGMAELGGRVNLTADGRYFCEFSGRYEYLKAFDLVAGTGTSEVGLEGYSAAIGFGVAL